MNKTKKLGMKAETLRALALPVVRGDAELEDLQTKADAAGDEP